MPTAVARLLAGCSLAACIVLAVLYFWGLIGAPAFRSLLVAASVAWFVFATLGVRSRGS